MMNTTPERLVLIDAYAQIYRCFFAVRAELTNPQGVPTNALYGIARLLLQLHRTLPSRYGAIAFDKGKCTRRITLCPEYKAQRPPMPDTMRPQIEPIRQWMKAFGWPLLEQEGVEADDLIAAITRRHGECEVAIVTHDKDIMQLTADPKVFIAQPDKDKWSLLGSCEVTQRFGVPPEQLRDYLALLGDSSWRRRENRRQTSVAVRFHRRHHGASRKRGVAEGGRHTEGFGGTACTQSATDCLGKRAASRIHRPQ